MSEFKLYDQFLDSNDIPSVPLTITADVQTDRLMKRESVVIKSVVAHFTAGEVDILKDLSRGTVGIFEQLVSEAYDSHWSDGAA